MNSHRFLAVLEKDGFDAATAETIVNMADAKPIDEAAELLASMLGEKNPHVDSYLANRRHAETAKKAAMSRHIIVRKQKPGKGSGADSSSTGTDEQQQPKQPISNADKMDSLKDLEAAVERLAIDRPGRESCDCLGSRHGLFEMAPNCLNCGRIVCNREGLGPCLYCHEPLLPTETVKQISDILNQQRSAVIASMSKRALAAAGIDSKAKQDATSAFASTADAEAQLERLLGYQASESVRTRIIDQVGDVDLPTHGVNQWSTPQEQAEELRKQQQRLRKMELERKARLGQGRKVLSIDVRGNKIYQSIENAPIEDELEELEDTEPTAESQDQQPEGGDNFPKDAPPVPYFDTSSVKSHPVLKAPSDSQGVSGRLPSAPLKSSVHRDENELLLY